MKNTLNKRILWLFVTAASFTRASVPTRQSSTVMGQDIQVLLPAARTAVENKNYARALAYCQKGLADAKLSQKERSFITELMGYIYRTGDATIKKNYASALFYYNQVLKYPELSQERLIRIKAAICSMYCTGDATVEKNYSKALSYCNQLLAIAELPLLQLISIVRLMGDIYRVGDATVMKNCDVALKYYKRVSELVELSLKESAALKKMITTMPDLQVRSSSASSSTASSSESQIPGSQTIGVAPADAISHGIHVSEAEKPKRRVWKRKCRMCYGAQFATESDYRWHVKNSHTHQKKREERNKLKFEAYKN